jgi:hypothetical protein
MQELVIALPTGGLDMAVTGHRRMRRDPSDLKLIVMNSQRRLLSIEFGVASGCSAPETAVWEGGTVGMTCLRRPKEDRR